MAPRTCLAVVPPPPSFDPSSYEPFDDEVNRTIDQILSEEASFESSRDEDWPVYSGEDNSSASNHPTLYTRKEVKESRFFSKSPATNGTKVKGKKKPVAKRSITVIELDSDSEDNTAPRNTNGQGSKQGKDNDPDPGNEADNESPTSDQTPNKVNELMDLWNPLSGGDGGAPESSTNDDAVVAEEDVIFASTEPSQRDHLLDYVVSHPFMQNRVQPVQRSARRHFVSEIRREAASAGMDDTATDRLIKYVRKLYLEEVGVKLQTLPEGINDVPFGEEIEDDYLEKDHRKRSGKRRLDHGEQMESKKSKRKKERKETSTPSLQSALQQEVSRRIQAVKSSPQDPLKCEENEKHTVSPGHTMDVDSHRDDRFPVTENGNHALRDVVQPGIQRNEATAVDLEHTQNTTIEFNDNSVVLGETRVEKADLPSRQPDDAPQGPDMVILAESSCSKPEMSPTYARLTRKPKMRKNKETENEEPGEATKVSPPKAAHPNDMVINPSQANLPSKLESVSEPAREVSIITLEASSNGHPEKQRRDVKASSKQFKENGSQGSPVIIVRQSELSDAEREMRTELPEGQSKKLLNWRKKERKKRKRRQSRLECQGNPPTDHQAHEPQPTPAKSPIPVAISEPKTPNKSPGKSKYPDLSPNPAEWDLDF